MDPVQQLYRYLDHCDMGDCYIAWYGQLRARGLDHVEAIRSTIDHFGLERKQWFTHRDLPKL